MDIKSSKDSSKDSQWIQVRTSDIDNKGVFAVKDIPKGTEIIEYTGEKITKEEADRRLDAQSDTGRVYIFELDDEYDIDGLSGGSDAIYINHSCDPNSEVKVEDGRITIVALRDIKTGEEIAYDYNFDFDEDTFDAPCCCGAKNCRGYLVGEDQYHELKEHVRAKKQGNKAGIVAISALTMLQK